MEYFLPSIAALLISALIVFLVLPRLGASALVILSIALLVFCLYNHYKLFGAEYRYSTWQEKLKSYAPFIMYGTLTIVILMYLGYLFNKQGPSMLPASNLSDEPVSILGSVNHTGNSALTSIANGLGMKPTTVNSNAPVLTNLGNILSSPNKRNQHIL